MRKMAVLAVVALAVSGCSLLGDDFADAGECVNLDEDVAEVQSLAGFSCDDLHDAEVFYNGDMDYDGDYDMAAVDEAAFSECLDHFEEYTGKDIYATELQLYYLYPLEEGYDSGDRGVVCAAYTPNFETGEIVPTTGSVKADAGE